MEEFLIQYIPNKTKLLRQKHIYSSLTYIHETILYLGFKRKLSTKFQYNPFSILEETKTW